MLDANNADDISVEGYTVHSAYTLGCSTSTVFKATGPDGEAVAARLVAPSDQRGT